MMFLLQWEPKLSTCFETLTSRLKVFVDNSIIIPALSEYYLADGNRRQWNLLIGAKKAGISMFINETLLDELVFHFKMIKLKYENFVDPRLRTIKEELITYLQEIFGITYISNEAWDIKINPDEKTKLTETLSSKKSENVKAENDAEMMLAIYYLRKKNNESSTTGIFGYNTWWLSKDTVTYKALIKCFGGEQYPVSCYIRPDFIYNYIALKPTSEEVNKAYNDIFPTMLGVNLSYHMSVEVSKIVQEKIKEFHNKPPVRVKQILRTLSDQLKSDPRMRTRKTVELFLDRELKKPQNI